MNIRQQLSKIGWVAMMGALLALALASTALAQVGGDGDGLDGDELVLPILVGVAVLGYVGWMAIRGCSRKSS
jgi:hypothetical protein